MAEGEPRLNMRELWPGMWCSGCPSYRQLDGLVQGVVNCQALERLS